MIWKGSGRGLFQGQKRISFERVRKRKSILSV